ncbi:putative PEP-binding protein [Candidatus Omnitrophota bacterium]
MLESWQGKKARDYREMVKDIPEHHIPEHLGTAVNVQTMVFGNMGDDSGTGVIFSRDLATGKREENKLWGDFLLNGQGEDVVAGIRTPVKIGELQRIMPEQYDELLAIAKQLEKKYRDVQDIEFTIERGKLFMLQTRTAKRSPQAELKIAMDMYHEGLISAKEASTRVSTEGLEILLNPKFNPEDAERAREDGRLLTEGIDASPGAASGRIVLSAEKAIEMSSAEGKPVGILTRSMTKPDDVTGISKSVGVLTSEGGPASHAALVTRGLGIPAVVGADEVIINEAEGTVIIGNKIFKEGDWISIDGTTGEVFEGEILTVDSPIFQYTLVSDQDKARRESPIYAAYQDLIALCLEDHPGLEVWTNVDIGKDAKEARLLHAKGIGLTRTEHMFFEPPERIPLVQRMLLGALIGETEVRDSAIKKILPLQKEDFKELFKEMNGLPVIIRLLDPPVHEFLPKLDEEERIGELAKEIGKTVDEMRDILKETFEENPMFGYRGARWLLHFPEIARMQVRAILEAAIEVQKDGIEVLPKIMEPMVDASEEFAKLRVIMREEAEEVFREKGQRVDYKIGTMIETARAPFIADKLIKEGAEFFSFGTNDLTQTTLGLSREDVGFIPLYMEKGIYPTHPFKTVDNLSVGALIVLTKLFDSEGIEIGICGEHGGDPRTIKFLHKLRISYVSASPRRLPVAILAARQAVNEEERGDETKEDILKAIATANRLKNEVIPAVRNGRALVEPRPVSTRISFASHDELSKTVSAGNKSVDLNLTHVILGNSQLLSILRRAILLGMATDDDAVFSKELENFKDALERVIRATVSKETLENVSISLLDVSLSSLLNVPEEEIELLSDSLGITEEELRERIGFYKEANPLFAERGARFLINRGEEIFSAQLSSIFAAAKGFSGNPTLQINVPYVSEVGELKEASRLARGVAEEYNAQFKLGIVIETPKALMIASSLVETGLADGLVIDLLDLTQATWGMTRADAQDFMQSYLDQGIIEVSPFNSLDREGVLVLITDAIREARKVKPDIPIEITGPQLVDAKSRETLVSSGIDGLIESVNSVALLNLPWIWTGPMDSREKWYLGIDEELARDTDLLQKALRGETVSFEIPREWTSRRGVVWGHVLRSNLENQEHKYRWRDRLDDVEKVGDFYIEDLGVEEEESGRLFRRGRLHIRFIPTEAAGPRIIKTREEMVEKVIQSNPTQITLTLYDYRDIEGASIAYDTTEGLYELEKSPFLNDKDFVVKKNDDGTVEVLCLDLPQMGSTEYNKWTVAAGDVVKQPVTELDEKYINGTMASNPALNSYLEAARKQGYAHKVGTLQEAAVHASLRHVYYLIKLMKENEIEDFMFDFCSDGRDENEKDSLGRVRQLRQALKYFGIQEENYDINIRGRARAFDRGGRWGLTLAWINELLWGSRIDRSVSYTKWESAKGTPAASMEMEERSDLAASGVEKVLEKRNSDGMSNFPLDLRMQNPGLFKRARELKTPIYSKADDTIYVWDADGLEKALQEQYDQGKNDEEMISIITIDEDGMPKRRLNKGGAILDVNFRKDRQKQWIAAVTDPNFDEFPVYPEILGVEVTAMTRYLSSVLPQNVIQKDFSVKNGLVEVETKEGIYVVYVLDAEKGKFIPILRGGREEPFNTELEDLESGNISMPVPMSLEQINEFKPYYYKERGDGEYIAWFKGALPGDLKQIENADYTQYPGLSMIRVAEANAEKIKEAKPGTGAFTNISGPDLIGHVAIKNLDKVRKLFVEAEDGTFKIKEGNGLDSILECLAITDRALGMTLEALKERKGVAIIFGDHGSVDDMKLTGHGLNDVPIFIVDFEKEDVRLVKAKGDTKDTQADIAVTELHILGVKKPKEMTGKSLLPDDYDGRGDRIVWKILVDGFGHTDFDDPNNAFGIAMKKGLMPVVSELYADAGDALVILNASGKDAGLRGGRQGDFEGIGIAPASIVPVARKLSEYKNNTIIFLGDDVEANLEGFKVALGQLDETQRAVVIAENERQKRAINQKFRLEYADIPPEFEVLTLKEAGLEGFDFNRIMDRDSYGIEDIANIRFVPLSEVVNKYPAIKATKISV